MSILNSQPHDGILDRIIFPLLVTLLVYSMLMSSTLQAAPEGQSPIPVVEGNLMSWPAVSARSINIHQDDGTYIDSLPGNATFWMAPEPGDYYLVATNEGDWTTWPRSVTVVISESTQDTPMPVVAGNDLTWPAVSARSINVHKGDGSYIDSLPGNATSWTAPEPGDYYLVATNGRDWTTWLRSITVVVSESAQNYIRVDFDITVPAYVSSTLQVRLVWGDRETNAEWVGDEYWTATDEYSTNTEQILTVTFTDRNGALELGRFEKVYRTGSNVTESFQIIADMFDANRFDTDQDGVNNLAELIAGTDPLVDEDSLLPIRNTFVHSRWSRMSVSRHFESHVSDDRPFIDTLSSVPHEGQSLYRDVSIDAEGNGTLTYNFYAGSSSLNISGTRTKSENSVSWEGVRIARFDYGHRVNVNNTVTYIDENTRAFVEEIEGSNVGTYTDTWETSSNLIGRLIEGTSLCVPVAGTMTTTQRSNRGSSDNYTYTISKDVDDQYWRVGSGTNGYFVRELIMLRSYCGTSCGSYTEPEPDDKYFTCDFVDF